VDYRQQYQNEWDEFFDAGGEAHFRPTPRTMEQLAEREISVEEAIAVDMLHRDRDTFGTYEWAERYVQNVINDRNYVELLPFELLDRVQSVEDRVARHNGSARLYLANQVVRHRRTGFSSDRTMTDLGFGISVTTSLAAEIVNYHRRMLYTLEA